MKKVYIPISVLNLIFLFILINTSYLVTHVSYILIISLSIVTILAFEIINYLFNRNKKLFLFLFTTLLILFTILILLSIYRGIHNYSYLVSYFKNLAKLAISIDNLTAVSAPVDFLLIRPFYILIMPIVTFLYMILFKSNLGKAVTVINTLVLLLFDILGFSHGVEITLPLYIFLAFINYNLFALSKNTKKHSKTLVLYYLVICISISGFIYWYTPSKEGKLTSIAEKKINHLLSSNWRDVQASNNDVSNYASVGINTDTTSTLGKQLELNDKNLALVSGDVPKYLRTKVYYDYNYDRWTNNTEPPTIYAYNLLNVPDLITNSGLAKRNIEYNKKKGSKIRTFSVQHLDDNFFNVMISPNYVSQVVSSSDSQINFYYDENYLTGKGQSEYTISYYNYSDTETFENFSKSVYRNDINDFYRGIGDINANGMTLGISLDYTSSARVSQLAHEITSKTSNNIEKVKLIQSYLLNNFSYDLKPSPMKNSSDYSDFFLFDEKKGYCKSFASAAVMLCRAVGIPARYVEGFKINGDKDANGNYTLKASEAHAWCEVLTSADKGVWSVLETTPGYQSSTVGNSENSTSSIANKENSNTENDTQEINKQKEEESSNKENLNTPTATVDQSNAIANYKLNLNKVLENYKYIILGISIILLCVLLKLIRRKLIIKNITNNKSSIPLYIFILKRLKTISISKKTHETDMEFALRLKNKLDIEPLIDAIYKEAYGNENTDLNKNLIISIVENLVKNNSNTFKYYLLF